MRDVLLLKAARPDGAARMAERARALLLAHRAHRDDEALVAASVDERTGWALVQAEPGWTSEADVGMFRGDGEALAYTGYVALPDRSAAAMRHLIRFHRRRQDGGDPRGPIGGDSLELIDSPGGVAAFFFVRGHAAFAWSSHAGVEGVFYTEADGNLAISNRPLLSHLAATGRAEPSFSVTWGRRILVGDSSLWGDTPYEGTRALAPRAMLVADAGGVSLAPHPVALSTERLPERSAEGVVALVEAARGAMLSLHRRPVAELQLSGGKDSRLVAALVVDAGIEVDPVTYAPPHGGEAIVARRVAEALGLPHRLADRPLADGQRLEDQVLANLRRADGLLGENRQLAFPPIVCPRGQPVLEGQAHHPRGGFLTTMGGTRATARARLHGQLGGDPDLVIEPLAVERRTRVDELLDALPEIHRAELAYWLYSDWRPPLLQGPYLSIARHRRLIYPMMDERVLRVCASLATLDRVRETTFFAALVALAPSLGALPLYDNTWKFDRGDAGETPFPSGFETRSVPVLEAREPGDHPRRTSPEKRLSTVRPLFRAAMHDLRASADVRAWIRPQVLAALLDHDEPSQTLGIENQRIVRFMWKATAVAHVLDGGWQRAGATSPADSDGASALADSRSGAI